MMDLKRNISRALVAFLLMNRTSWDLLVAGMPSF